ncbi:MAG: sel1 repeat family protein [Deltaproteobacteria bacterium]|jgi:TPR repeat protein|nr:sel1 repeat family protein [Deltaproteobacteria bacterium]
MRFITFIFILAGLILGPVGPTLATAEKAPNLAPGSSAPLNADFENLKKKAEAGDATAQFQLSVVLLNLGLQTNVKNDQKSELFLEAFQWVRRAADLGHPKAMDVMGDVYYVGAKEVGQSFGLGEKEIGPIFKIEGQAGDLAKNLAEARRWYQKAADHGEFYAMLKLASLYATGQGGPKDPVAAQKYTKIALDLATSQKDPNYLTRMATIYEKGENVPPDLALSAKLWGQAAELGDASAKRRHDELQKESEGQAKSQK